MKQKPMLYRGGLTDRIFVATKYENKGGNRFRALEQFDVTEDFLRLCYEYTQEYTITPVEETEEGQP